MIVLFMVYSACFVGGLYPAEAAALYEPGATFDKNYNSHFKPYLFTVPEDVKKVKERNAYCTPFPFSLFPHTTNLQQTTLRTSWQKYGVISSFIIMFSKVICPICVKMHLLSPFATMFSTFSHRLSIQL